MSIEQIDDAGVAIVGEGVDSDANGFWERRALADGRYRVSWEPPIPVELYSQTIPPAETIVVNPNLTIQRVTQFVEIAGANRVADVDFGIPAPAPAAGAVTAPNTGAGDSRSQAPILVLAAAAAIALLGAAALTLRGPRRM